jgi:methylmalonyl-CoA mutase C-terminal domain/subunit
MEVIYLGLFQSPEAVARSAVDEDVDIVGLSILSGAHLTLTPLVIAELRRQSSHIPVVLGGIVPDEDVPVLREMGVAATFGPGSSMEEIVNTLERVHLAASN